MTHHARKDFVLGVSPSDDNSLAYLKIRLKQMGYNKETVKIIKKGNMFWALKRQTIL